MADFPSIEEFDAGQTTTNVNGNSNTNDMDFLAREKAALGGEADFFGSDEPVNMPSSSVADADVAAFESDFPALEDAPAPAPAINSSSFAQPPRMGTPSTIPSIPEPDSEHIKEWREKQKIMIDERDQASNRKKQQTIQEAQKAIDEFYENYGKKKAKSIEQNKRDEEELQQGREDITSGTTWERISKQINLGGPQSKALKISSSRDTSRMKEVLLSLKSDPKAPGAGGY